MEIFGHQFATIVSSVVIGLGIIILVSPSKLSKVGGFHRSDATSVGVNSPLVGFKCLNKNMDESRNHIVNAGFNIVSIIKLNQEECYIFVSISSKLLCHMTAIYSKDLSNHGSVEILQPHFQLMMTEKAVQSLGENFLSKHVPQNIHLLPNSVHEALQSGRSVAILNEFSNVFGCNVAILFSWLEFAKQSLFPSVLFWFLILISNEWEYAPVIGTLSSLIISCCISYWKSTIPSSVQKFTKIRSISNNIQLNVKAPKRHFVGYFVVVVILVVYVFVLILWAKFFGTIFKIYFIPDEICYYVCSMICSNLANYLIGIQLNQWYSLGSKSEGLTARTLIQFSIKVSIFLVKCLLFLVSGKTLFDVQSHMTVLMTAHLMLSGIFSPQSGYFWSRVPGSGVNMMQPSPEDSVSSDKDCKSIHLDNLIDESVPTAFETYLIREISKPHFSTDHICSDSILAIAITMIISPISPVSIPLCLLYIWHLTSQSLRQLIDNCRKPSTVDEATCLEPWITIIEVFSIMVLALNIGTLFVFCIDLTTLPTALNVQHINLVDGLVLRALTYLNSCFGLSNNSLTVVLWLLVTEHFVLLFRCLLWPYIVGIVAGFDLQMQLAVITVSEWNNIVSTVLFQEKLISDEMYVRTVGRNYDQCKQKYDLVESRNQEDYSMSPLLYAALALIPYLFSTFFRFSWFVTALPLSLLCGYYFGRINRSKHAAALSIVSDPGVFDKVAQTEPEIQRFMACHQNFETDRSDWCNKMFALSWRALKEYAFISISKVAGPALENNKPSFASYLTLSKLTMGNVPPHFLPGGIRILEVEPGSEMVELEVDIVWNSDMEMAISLGLAMGQEITINLTNLQFSGTCRVQCLPLIPTIPPFAFGKATFFKRPFIDFSLQFGDTELLDSGTSSSTVSTVMRRILRNVLETMALYPTWITINMVSNPERFLKYPVETYTVSSPVGVLSIKVLNCKDLTIGDITSSDPYVVLTMRDEEFKTDVIYADLNPVWKDAQFHFLVYDKVMESVRLEVWDKDVGSVGTFLGRVDVFFPHLVEGTSQLLTLQLQAVSHGTITLELGYSVIENSLPNKPDADAKINLNKYFESLTASKIQSMPELAGIGLKQNISKRLSISPKFPLNIAPVGCVENSVAGSKPLVAGVLIISAIGFENVKSVKGMLKSTQYFSPYITFALGNSKRQTNLSSEKKTTAKFSETFIFVVKDLKQEILFAKLKYVSTMRKKTTLAECCIKVQDVVDIPGGSMVVKQNIFDELKLAMGEIHFTLKFRSTTENRNRNSSVV